jgi:hypothetical protein
MKHCSEPITGVANGKGRGIGGRIWAFLHSLGQPLH